MQPQGAINTKAGKARSPDEAQRNPGLSSSDGLRRRNTLRYCALRATSVAHEKSPPKPAGSLIHVLP